MRVSGQSFGIKRPSFGQLKFKFWGGLRGTSSKIAKLLGAPFDPGLNRGIVIIRIQKFCKKRDDQWIVGGELRGRCGSRFSTKKIRQRGHDEKGLVKRSEEKPNEKTKKSDGKGREKNKKTHRARREMENDESNG